MDSTFQRSQGLGMVLLNHTLRLMTDLYLTNLQKYNWVQWQTLIHLKALSLEFCNPWTSGQIKVFATASWSRINADFYCPWCGLFLTCGRKKLVRHITFSYSVLFTSSFYVIPLNMIQFELLSLWLVLAWTGPPCPHAHSILIFTSSLFSSWSVQAPTLSFPLELLGLPVPVQILEHLASVPVSGSLTSTCKA